MHIMTEHGWRRLQVPGLKLAQPQAPLLPVYVSRADAAELDRRAKELHDHFQPVKSYSMSPSCDGAFGVSSGYGGF